MDEDDMMSAWAPIIMILLLVWFVTSVTDTKKNSIEASVSPRTNTHCAYVTGKHGTISRFGQKIIDTNSVYSLTLNEDRCNSYTASSDDEFQDLVLTQEGDRVEFSACSVHTPLCGNTLHILSFTNHSLNIARLPKVSTEKK